jgi:hypothetical protein
VDRADWPASLGRARTVLSAMPKQLGGSTAHRYYNDGVGEDPPSRDAGITYGKSLGISVFEEYVSHDTPSGKPELMSANNLLSAAFGLGLACAKHTYRGTAPRPSYPGGGPGVTTVPLKKAVWFSCKVDGAEGDANFTAYAVGWTSKHLAWLVVGTKEEATRIAVKALHTAAT